MWMHRTGFPLWSTLLHPYCPCRSRWDYCRPIMASDRVQRQIDGIHDEAEASVKQLNWRVVHNRGEAVLAIGPENPDGLTYLATTERAMVALPLTVDKSPGLPLIFPHNGQ